MPKINYSACRIKQKSFFSFEATKTMKSFLFKYPVFLYLLPFFFIFHGFAENFHYSLTNEAIELLAIYLGVSLVFASLFWLFFRDFYKASLVSFYIMAFNFFFGSFHDFLKKYFPDTIFIKYTLLTGVSLLLLLLLIIYLKRTKKSFTNLAYFLNSLFLLLIAIEIVTFIPKILKGRNQHVSNLSGKLITNDTFSKPDIYLIIADEYAGSKTLKDMFFFNNSAFESELRNRGFHVIEDTKSNYYPTVYSMASLLNMDYLNYLDQNIVNHSDMLICYDLIKNNNLLSFLKEKGYQALNYSPFDLDSKRNYIISTFNASKKELFTSQTFLNRFWHDIRYHFIKKNKIKAVRDKNLFSNNKIDSATRNIVKKENSHPKFVYTHLHIPHYPYYFDSSGKETLYNSITHTYPEEKKDYIQYLVYSNKKLLSLIDYIRQVSPNPPVIILMSDHGYRQFKEYVDPKYYFMNFNAVYLPNGNYSGFYKGMSNVNQFRIILNSQFSQKLPMLKDSISFLR